MQLVRLECATPCQGLSIQLQSGYHRTWSLLGKYHQNQLTEYPYQIDKQFKSKLFSKDYQQMTKVCMSICLGGEVRKFSFLIWYSFLEAVYHQFVRYIQTSPVDKSTITLSRCLSPRPMI